MPASGGEEKNQVQDRGLWNVRTPNRPRVSPRVSSTPVALSPSLKNPASALSVTKRVTGFDMELLRAAAVQEWI